MKTRVNAQSLSMFSTPQKQFRVPVAVYWKKARRDAGTGASQRALAICRRVVPYPRFRHAQANRPAIPAVNNAIAPGSGTAAKPPAEEPAVCP